MKNTLLLFVFVILFSACSSSEGGDSSGDGFNRQTMLTNWADNIIIPSFSNYQSKVVMLQNAVTVFNANPTEANLQQLRAEWLEAYKAFQYVSGFEIGKAEEISFVNCTNVYPINNAGIEANIASGAYNLSLISQYDKQGFPAFDYLINGLGADDATIVSFYVSNANATNYKQYLTDLAVRLKANADLILNDWNNGYRATFINASGNSISSSVNRMVNIYVQNFEKNVRAGKVGFPAGVFSSGTTYPEKVEAYYKNDVSKVLLTEAVKASNDFFNGKYFNGTETGSSLRTYLEYLNTQRNGQLLSVVINNQFNTINAAVALLNDSFSAQILADNTKMIAAYDEMQWNVSYFKTNMMPAMNISVDYVDNDGD